MRHTIRSFFSYTRRLYTFSRLRWRYLFYSLSRREKLGIATLLLIASLSSFFLAGYEYWIMREAAPARGGQYAEGVLGFPRFVNPVLGTNNETDRDVIAVLFAGLTTYDTDGNIVGDLAESFEVRENGQVYEFNLRENLRWSDGEPLRVADVLFTIERIQSPEFQSPLRGAWQGVRAEQIDERTVRFTLNLPFRPFLENTTVGILPKHHWEAVSPANFALAELNIKPIGAGPYAVRSLTRDASGVVRAMELEPNPHYHKPVYIEKVVFRFYETEDALFSGLRRGEIDGLGVFSPQALREFSGRDIAPHTLRMPRYFAVFFNQEKNDILEDIRVRRALNLTVPRDTIVTEILFGEGEAQIGPFPPWFLSPDTANNLPNVSEAEALLSSAGWEYDEDEGVRVTHENDEISQRLELTLTTTDWPELTQVASVLQQHWEDIGVRVFLDVVPIATMQNTVVRPREYEALLFGNVLGADPDPFAFWHSSQTGATGLNLSEYENSRVDTLLERARQTTDEAQYMEAYREFQDIIIRDVPALFIYNPHYIYALPRNIQGFEETHVGVPSHRFNNIHAWYITTQRVRP